MGPAALVADAVSFLFMLTVLALDLSGVLRRGKPLRMTITGLLLMNGAALIRMIAGERGWSRTSLLAVDWIGLALTLTGVGVGLAGVLSMFREQDGARRGHPGE
jgi:NADH:ubiquinone oxidoreductase subunit K